MNNLKNKNVYLLLCEGQGDIDVGIVNEETWNWIFSPYASSKNSYKENIPTSICEAYPQTTYSVNNVNLSIGSYENDRVLQGPKFSFNSVKEAMSFIKKNNCNLVDEFHGDIY